MVALGTMRQRRTDLLKEGATADLIVPRAHHAERQPSVIPECGARPEGGATCGQIGERRKESRLNGQ